jgi:hypothetical protein
VSKLFRTLKGIGGWACIAGLLAGCATNGAGQIPSNSQANLGSNALQLAVGTARIGQDGVVGLNVVATLRQPNGLSGTLANTPTITGPSGFTVPASAPGAYDAMLGTPNTDDGTNHISASPQVPPNNTGLINTTLGTFTGVFSYGFGPFNSDNDTASLGAYYPGQPNGSFFDNGNGFVFSDYSGSSILSATLGTSDPTQPLPFFAASAPFDYLVGPPAVPFFNNGTFPNLFAGYSPGFTTFELTPVSGQYSLAVKVAAQNAAPVTYNATANLSSTAGLGPISVTFTGAAGGGSGTVTVPAGVTETEVFIVDGERGLYYTVGPLTGTGSIAYTLPGTLGPCNGSSCQTGSAATPSIASGDTVFVSAVGYDYPAFEAGPPGNTKQKPTITGANGQADLTTSPIVTTTEP